MAMEAGGLPLVTLPFIVIIAFFVNNEIYFQ
jgi:hypothetical protein